MTNDLCLPSCPLHGLLLLHHIDLHGARPTRHLRSWHLPILLPEERGGSGLVADLRDMTKSVARGLSCGWRRMDRQAAMGLTIYRRICMWHVEPALHGHAGQLATSRTRCDCTSCALIPHLMTFHLLPRMCTSFTDEAAVSIRRWVADIGRRSSRLRPTPALRGAPIGSTRTSLTPACERTALASTSGAQSSGAHWLA